MLRGSTGLGGGQAERGVGGREDRREKLEMFLQNSKNKPMEAGFVAIFKVHFAPLGDTALKPIP